MIEQEGILDPNLSIIKKRYFYDLWPYYYS